MEQQDVILQSLFSDSNYTQSHPRAELRGPEVQGGEFWTQKVGLRLTPVTTMDISTSTII